MKADDHAPALVIMLKAPVPGKVKTRLAQEIGTQAACSIYRQLVERQVSMVPIEWPVEIHFTPASARAEFLDWLGPTYRYFPQAGGDLGRRLRLAAAGAFGRGHRHVILIGGDCPAMDASTLLSAADILKNEKDVLIGPALDGGYYLLGLSRPVDSLFREIPWSGPDVARMTAERANAAGLRLAWLEEKEDVDDIDGYLRAVEAGYLEGPL